MSLKLDTTVVSRSHGLRLVERSINSNTRTADFIASTAAIDSYDEIVEQVWRLERFKSNPVVLFAHRSRELPIGKCTRVEMVEGNLECTIQFCTDDMNPLAEQVWKMVLNGFLRGVSVGFLPHSMRWEKREDKEVYVLSDNELYEISVTPIPANEEALSKDLEAAKAAARSKALVSLSAEEAPVVAEPVAVVEPVAAPANDEGKADAAEEVPAAETEPAAEEAVVAELPAEAPVVAPVAANDNAVPEEPKLASASDAGEDLALVARALNAHGSSLVEVVERIAKLVAERDALRDTVITSTVDSLIGTKLLPHQRDVFINLAKSDKASFDTLVASLPTLKLYGAVIPTDKEQQVAASRDLAEMLGDDEQDTTEGNEEPAVELSSLL